MLIKNYFTNSDEIGGVASRDLNIIENVTEVTVYSGCFSPKEGILGKEPGPVVFFGSENTPENKMVRHIDFIKNGCRCRLIVTGCAYVCNDEGKTIEKVST